MTDATDSQPDEPQPLTGLRLVVVSGLPRSGTSMLMQMLVAGGMVPFADGQRAPDASNPRGYVEHDRVRALARDAGWLPEADGRVVKVVAPLLPHLPPGPSYHVVLLTRRLDEVLRSQRAMLGRLGHAAAADAALGPVYTRMLDAARAWTATTPGVRTLELDHAAVVADPAAASARLAAFLDRPLDAAAMAAVVDPALHRERDAA